MAGFGAGRAKFALQISQGDIEVQHGHLGRSVAE